MGQVHVVVFINLGWYFAGDLDHTLFGNVAVNGLDEWDPDKLGWVKTSGGGGGKGRDRIDHSGSHIRSRFAAKVKDCGANQYVAEVKAKRRGLNNTRSCCSCHYLGSFSYGFVAKLTL